MAVPTPFKGEPNLDYIESASRAKVLKKGDLVILESTVGATEKMAF